MPPRTTGPAGRESRCSVSREDLRQACEATVLLGCKMNVPTVADVFVEAYAKLVWFIIRRRGIADGGHPAAEDVFQETFCGLHRQLRRGLTLERARLATYVSCAAVHACARPLEKARRAPQVLGEGNREPEPEGDASGAQCGSVLHPEAVEVWE